MDPVSRRLIPFAMLLSIAWLAPLACKANNDASASPSTGPSPRTSINVEANEKGFTPSSVEVKKGAQITLVFTRTTDATCATQVVFPELKLTKDLPLNKPVSIDVPTGGDARTLTFQCGMGMFKGKVVIQS